MEISRICALHYEAECSLTHGVKLSHSPLFKVTSSFCRLGSLACLVARASMVVGWVAQENERPAELPALAPKQRVGIGFVSPRFGRGGAWGRGHYQHTYSYLLANVHVAVG